MPLNFFPALTFILITTFTPGPNNISSAAMGVLHGYRNTLNYLLGITCGFLLMMFVNAWISASLLALFPSFETILRYLGAGYILYLAFGMLKASYSFGSEAMKPLSFLNGFMLQLLNPKLIVYGLTLFSTFLAPIASNPLFLMVAVVVLAFVSFCAISTWTLFGATIKIYLHHPRARWFVNSMLALFLVYTALNIVGFL